jgi:hypothetical protein
MSNNRNRNKNGKVEVAVQEEKEVKDEIIEESGNEVEEVVETKVEEPVKEDVAKEEKVDPITDHLLALEKEKEALEKENKELEMQIRSSMDNSQRCFWDSMIRTNRNKISSINGTIGMLTREKDDSNNTGNKKIRNISYGSTKETIRLSSF